MAAGDTVLYFEGSWSILSSIGLVNLLLGFMVMGITGYSPIALVPIVVSAAAAVANGLSWYALYEDHSTNATLASGVFADLFWLVCILSPPRRSSTNESGQIQEAGLSFYSYMILNRVLRSRSRLIFLSLFWLLMTVIVVLRCSILVFRARSVMDGDPNLQTMVAHLHIGYFVSIAIIEILSAVFLLRIFKKAKRASVEAASRGGLFHYLTQSTELRLATLALIGVTRAITYSFQKAKKASDVTGQVDRFVFTLECMFPMIM